jgi:hypothetical protein
MTLRQRGACFMGLFISLVLLILSGKSAQAGMPATLPLSNWTFPSQRLYPGGLAAQVTAQDKPLLTRVYYSSRADLQKLSAHLDIWEIHPEQGYLLALLTQAERQELIQAGYRIEIDIPRNDKLYQPRLVDPEQTSGIPGYACYRTLTETYTSAQAIALAHPNLATWTAIGPSWEKANLPSPAGSDLYVLRLTNRAVPGPKPKLFIMASIHAREYAPAELATRFAETLLERYGSDPDITWLLDYREIHLLLQANPDGRKQAEKGLINGDYMWRKNTDANYCMADTLLRGADLNRNFPFQWGGEDGSSGNECEETYRGPSPASEPETQAVISYIKSEFPDRRTDDLTSPAPDNTSGLFIDLHSYGNLVLWPWGWTESPAPNQTGLEMLGRKLAYLNHYLPEQSDRLYATNGTTDDFAYGELGLAAYTIEVGTDFFQDCATFENTILPDNLPVLVAAAKAAGKPYLEPSGPDILSVSITPTLSTPNNTAQISAFADDTRFSTQNGPMNFHNIAAAEYTIDTPPWITTTTPITHSMAALDGSFDQTTEYISATIDTRGLSAGRHTVFVRGKNAAGYWGATTSAFLYIYKGSTCTPINNINLNRLDSKIITAHEPVTFAASMQPYWVTTPITYTIDFGDGTSSNPITSTQITQIFTHTYAGAGNFHLQIRAWNCGLPAQQAIPASLDIEVVPIKYLFLPLIQ